MVSSLALVAVFAALAVPPPPPPPGRPMCVPVVADAAKTVAYLLGSYGVVGLKAGKPFTGSLRLEGTEDSESLALSGTFAGEPREGSVRYVQCVADRVRQLEVSFSSGERLYCVAHYNYGNHNRASCSPELGHSNGDQQLWFQRVAP